MKPQPSLLFLSKRQQQGWITAEVILCLVLFSIVLHLAQRQSEVQWQSIQLAEEQRKRVENQQKQTAMRHLIGDVAWIKDDNVELNLAYPNCQSCGGSQLQDWFYASLHAFSAEESDE